MEFVRIKIVKSGKKLRARVVSPGYNSEANCQFPRNIRVEGKVFEIPIFDLKFSQVKCKFFYRVTGKNIKEVLEDYSIPEKIFESPECIVCLDSPSTIILAPCGHFCLCSTCKDNIVNEKCPMCRIKVQHYVTKQQLQI